MATFPSNIEAHISSNPQEKQRFNKVQFGDGYYQISPHGINHIWTDWDMVFFKQNKSKRDEIIDFLVDNYGKSFDWTDPLGESFEVTCVNWTIDYSINNLYTIKAKFMRFF